MEADVSVTREVAAPAEEVWAMIADLPRMGEWSPENEGGEWLNGATGPAPGVTFRGTNRNGSKTWKMLVTLVDVEPGRRLSFRTSSMGAPSAEWSYDIEPTDTGCRVTESWTDAPLAMGVADLGFHLRSEGSETAHESGHRTHACEPRRRRRIQRRLTGRCIGGQTQM